MRLDDPLLSFGWQSEDLLFARYVAHSALCVLCRWDVDIPRCPHKYMNLNTLVYKVSQASRQLPIMPLTSR